MKNICKKIGKIFGIMGTFLFSIWNKVFAVVPPKEMLGNINPSEYGVPSLRNQFIDKILAFGKVFIIPVIVLIGVFIFLKKKDKEKYSGAITIIKRLLVIIAITFVIYLFYVIFKHL